MIDRLLYHTPGSCSRVALSALEEIGLPYREESVALHNGIQYQPEFLAINVKGKVPVLIEDGVVFTELPVILYHLATAHPEAGLLPAGKAPLSDLIWIAGTLHPLGGRLLRAEAVAPADPDGVRKVALQQLSSHAAMLSARIGQGCWWYGESWSITDTFAAWAFTLGEQLGFPLTDYPVLVDLRERTYARPAFVRTRTLEMHIAERDKIPSPPRLSL